MQRRCEHAMNVLKDKNMNLKIYESYKIMKIVIN
jgi:hypothetical protein